MNQLAEIVKKGGAKLGLDVTVWSFIILPAFKVACSQNEMDEWGHN